MDLFSIIEDNRNASEEKLPICSKLGHVLSSCDKCTEPALDLSLFEDVHIYDDRIHSIKFDD